MQKPTLMRSWKPRRRRAIHRNRTRQPSKKPVGTCNNVGRGEETWMSDCCSLNAKTGTAPAVVACSDFGGGRQAADPPSGKKDVPQTPPRRLTTTEPPFFHTEHSCLLL